MPSINAKTMKPRYMQVDVDLIASTLGLLELVEHFDKAFPVNSINNARGELKKLAEHIAAQKGAKKPEPAKEPTDAKSPEAAPEQTATSAAPTGKASGSSGRRTP